MKSLINNFGKILVLLSLIFLFIKLGQNVNEIKSFRIDLMTTLAVSAVILINLVSGAIVTYAWVLFLRSGGFILSFRKAYAIYGRAAVAKYIPGNVFHYVGRVALGGDYGIPKEKVVLSMVVETGILAVTAITFGCAGLLFEFSYYSSVTRIIYENKFITGFLAVFFLLTVIFISVTLLNRRKEWAHLLLSYLHPFTVLKSVLIYLVNFSLVGVSIYFLLNAFWEIDSGLQWYQLAYGFALAWGVGFIIPGAPGGIGIREFILVALYGPILGEGVIVGLALILRVLMTIGELLMFAIAYYNALSFEKK